MDVGGQLSHARRESGRIGDQLTGRVAGRRRGPIAVDPDDPVAGVAQSVRHHEVGDGRDLGLGRIAAEPEVGVPAHIGRGREPAVVEVRSALVDGGAVGGAHTDEAHDSYRHRRQGGNGTE
jgi:hypothetical protein